jgi:hypothetical protein
MTAMMFNKRHYYAGDYNYYGTDSAPFLVVKNLLRPSRFATKLRYGQVLPLPQPFVKTTPFDQRDIDPVSRKHVETLKKDGIVILPGYFADLAKRITDERKLDREHFSPSHSYQQQVIDPVGDEAICDILFDRMLLSVLALYYGSQPYLVDLPGINVAYPNLEHGELLKKKASVNQWWHYDMTNQLTIHVLLTDTNEADTAMLVAKRSHRVHHNRIHRDWDYYFSEEYVRDTYQVERCYGPQGTVVVFDSNALHRFDPIKMSFRSHLHLNYSPGNGIKPAASRLNDGKYARPGEFSAELLERYPRTAQLNALQRQHLRFQD